MPTVNQSVNAETRWLTCRIDKGMFNDELAVTYPPDGVWQKSVFVSASEVEGKPGQQGRMRVWLVPRNGLLMAVLPSANQDIVTVHEADLSQ